MFFKGPSIVAQWTDLSTFCRKTWTNARKTKKHCTITKSFTGWWGGRRWRPTFELGLAWHLQETADLPHHLPHHLPPVADSAGRQARGELANTSCPKRGRSQESHGWLVPSDEHHHVVFILRIFLSTSVNNQTHRCPLSVCKHFWSKTILRNKQ